MFEPVFTSTLAARAQVSERLSNLGRERVQLVDRSLLQSVRQAVARGYAQVETLLDELSRWSDSQRACEPGSLVLAEC